MPPTEGTGGVFLEAHQRAPSSTSSSAADATHNHCPDKVPAKAARPSTLEPAQRLLVEVIGHAAITAADAKILWTKLAEHNPAVDAGRFEELLFTLLARRLLAVHADGRLCLTDAGTAALATR